MEITPSLQSALAQLIQTQLHLGTEQMRIMRFDRCIEYADFTRGYFWLKFNLVNGPAWTQVYISGQKTEVTATENDVDIIDPEALLIKIQEWEHEIKQRLYCHFCGHLWGMHKSDTHCKCCNSSSVEDLDRMHAAMFANLLKNT